MKQVSRWLVTTVLLTGVAGAAPIVYNSTDVPKAIPDLTTTNSTLTITDSYFITDLNVTLNLTHTYDSDLAIFLVSPGGAVTIGLSFNNGGAGQNYTNTTFDDAAATIIFTGSAPFTGTFRPEQATGLSGLNGLNINGIWTLRIEDQVAVDSGTLLSWSITADGSESRVPEPATLGLVGLSLTAIGLKRFRK